MFGIHNGLRKYTLALQNISKRSMCPPAGSPNRLPAKRADQFQIYSPAALISNLASETARKNSVSHPLLSLEVPRVASCRFCRQVARQGLDIERRFCVMDRVTYVSKVQNVIIFLLIARNNDWLSSLLNVYFAPTVANIDVKNFERTSQLGFAASHPRGLKW